MVKNYDGSFRDKKIGHKQYIKYRPILKVLPLGSKGWTSIILSLSNCAFWKTGNKIFVNPIGYKCPQKLNPNAFQLFSFFSSFWHLTRFFHFVPLAGSWLAAKSETTLFVMNMFEQKNSIFGILVNFSDFERN